jgi:hypothetical protein
MTPSQSQIEPKGTNQALERPRGRLAIRRHERWPSIRQDILEGNKSPRQICAEYNLKTVGGALAISAVLQVRHSLKNKYASVLAEINEMERNALRQEYLDGLRSVVIKAKHGYDMAESSEKPNFAAMTDFLDPMLNAIAKIGAASGLSSDGEVVSVGPGGTLIGNQTNNVLQVMAMPRIEGQNHHKTQIQKVIEGSKDV